MLLWEKMGTEIERKFLVRGEAWRDAVAERIVMHQGYLAVEHGNSIRIRLAGGRAWLTIKGPAVGACRPEFEYTVPPEEALALLALCGTRVVEKLRYQVPYNGHVWEIDEYSGANAGLITAEVELDSERQKVALPPWVGPEVTADRRYGNASLSRFPFVQWPAADRNEAMAMGP